MNDRILRIACLLTPLLCFGSGVFDMPEKQIPHLRLLARMDAAHEAKNYAEMERASRDGVELGSSDELWFYNLACALALQKKTEEALAALDQAIARGFYDADFLLQDPDFAALRDAPALAERLARMNALRNAPRSPAQAALVALPPDAARTVMQTSSNTLWSFRLALFQTYFFTSNSPRASVYSGPEAPLIRAWEKEGSASAAADVLYANRDNNTAPADIARFPGALRLDYAPEMTARKLNIGLPNTLFTMANGDALLPVIGHSSLGYLNSPYWRSQPRAICCDPRQIALQSVFLLGNQLFFYPAYGDYTLGAGDLFPANIPYAFAAAGGNNAERPFLDAAFAALAALRPETRDALARGGLLMPALQMLFRASQRTVRNPRDYLTGVAHPPAFRAENLDTEKLVRMAHSLSTNDLPPLVTLYVQSETDPVPDRDYFDIVRTERLFDSPLAVARVFRGAARTRTLELRTRCRRADARLHWVVLQGDPANVAFAPCATNANLMTLTVGYQPPFQTPIGNGKKIATSRVDIGVIAETGAGFSMPAFISFYFLGNERRVYADDGRILSVDYTRSASGYTDPLLSYARNWKDVYRYDARNRLIGWVRRRGLTEEAFTAYGHRIVATDALGRAARAHVVRYLPRRLSDDAAADETPDLAEMDDNIEVVYRYASSDDLVGAPDLSTVTQEIQPPASEP